MHGVKMRLLDDPVEVAFGTQRHFVRTLTDLPNKHPTEGPLWAIGHPGTPEHGMWVRLAGKKKPSRKRAKETEGSGHDLGMQRSHSTPPEEPEISPIYSGDPAVVLNIAYHPEAKGTLEFIVGFLPQR
jgi:hypothetical protein